MLIQQLSLAIRFRFFVLQLRFIRAIFRLPASILLALGARYFWRKVAFCVEANAPPMDVKQIIVTKLTESLSPESLEVENVSHRHAHHQSSPLTGQSHFEVMVSSPKFVGLSRVQRHKLVYQILAEEMAGPIHALQVTARAPGEP